MSPRNMAAGVDRTGSEIISCLACDSCLRRRGAAKLRFMMKHSRTALALFGLALAGQAQAASPCPPGFAMLQASDTCVRISGRVRADSLVASSRMRSSDSFQSQASGRVQLDIRKQTEYGPFRAVIAVGNIRR